MTNRQFQSQKSLGIRFALIEANNGSRADDGNRDNRCHQK
jgi:hypothetical protein